MKKALLALFILLSSASYAQSPYTRENENGVTECFQNDGYLLLTSAVIKELSKEGAYSSETPCKDAKAEGIRKVRYSNGLKSEEPFKKGKREGVRKLYFENERLLLEVPYKKGGIEGTARRYYESGRLFMEAPYKNGKLEGAAKIYHENGELLATIIYERDTPVKAEGVNKPLTKEEILSVFSEEINIEQRTPKDKGEKRSRAKSEEKDAPAEYGERRATESEERNTPIVKAVRQVEGAVVSIFVGLKKGYQGLGTGVIINSQGLIVTNYHVIEGARNIEVVTHGGKKAAAAYIGGDASLDIAFLKVELTNLTAAKLGSSSDLLTGETVIAIGNPSGLSNSVTQGIVSNGRRVIDSAVYIQTDAAINPGNSGGPLINIKGEVIGINTLILKETQGIGFAIPIDVVKKVMPDLLNGGSAR